MSTLRYRYWFRDASKFRVAVFRVFREIHFGRPFGGAIEKVGQYGQHRRKHTDYGTQLAAKREITRHGKAPFGAPFFRVELIRPT